MWDYSMPQEETFGVYMTKGSKREAIFVELHLEESSRSTFPQP